MARVDVRKQSNRRGHRPAPAPDPQRLRQRRHRRPPGTSSAAPTSSSSYLEGSGVDLETYEPEPGRTSLVAKIDGLRPRGALADPAGPHRRGAGQRRRLAPRPVRRRADRRRGVGSGRHRHAQPHRHHGHRRPPPGPTAGSGPPGTSPTSPWPTRRPSAPTGPSGCASTPPTTSMPTTSSPSPGGFPMDGADGATRLPVIVGEKGVFWCTLTVKGTPGHGTQPLRTDNALVKAAEVVRRIDEYRPQAQLHEAWTRFIEGIGLPARARRAPARPRPHRRLLRRAAPARPGPPGPCLHPHHHGPDGHAGRHQGQRDPRPGRARGRHPHPAGVGHRRRAGHAGRGARRPGRRRGDRVPVRGAGDHLARSTPRCGTRWSGSASSSTPAPARCPS